MPLIGVVDVEHDAFHDENMAFYEDSLARSGAQMLVLDWEHDLERVDELAAECDAFILTGGGDIDPALYGEKLGDIYFGINPPRDAFEVALLDAVFPTGKPILAICRGFQMVNIRLGGTLYQDIPTEIGPSVVHAYIDRSYITRKVHLVTVTNDWFADILGEETSVNSSHHQSIKELGENLAVAATSEDGVIEAYEYVGEDTRWLKGVQWHPERLSAEYPEEQEIFDQLIEACR